MNSASASMLVNSVGVVRVSDSADSSSVVSGLCNGEIMRYEAAVVAVASYSDYAVGSVEAADTPS